MKLPTAIMCASFGIAVILLVAQIGCTEVVNLSSQEAQQGETDEPVFDPHVVIPTPFPAIKEINTETAEKASSKLGDGELVLGVSIDGKSRAYPITMLCGPTREIINDELGDTKFAATWWHLCHNGIVYVRQVDDRELNFCVSGKLWNRSLVMLDEETQSLWSHLLGKCMAGELKGVELKAIPSVISDWGSWKEQYPETDVMIWPVKGRKLDYNLSFYDDMPEQFVIGFVSGKTAKSYAFPQLREQPLVNDEVAGQPIVIWFDGKSGAAWCFDRKMNGKVLEFRQQDGNVIDVQTSSQWDLRNGVATDGALKGTKLTPRVVIPSFAQAWHKFHPNSEQWGR